jgi:LCP family protein required for cell wall assembly
VMINSLLAAGGPVCLWKTVEQQTGIYISHFIGIGMYGFVKVVDDLGGVNVCVPFKVNDPVSGLDLPAGEQHINGVQALAFWRTREDIGTGSDLERIQRDQFMSAQVVKGVLSSGLLSNPLRLLSVVSDAAAYMTTDSGMTASDLVGIGESLRHLSSKDVQFITAPNQSWPPNPDRVQFAQPQADEVFSAIAHDVTVPKVKVTPSATPSSGAQVLTTSPSNVKVKILNGSGVAGVASQAAAGLTSRGFDVTGTGNAASFAYTNSVIEYASTSDLAAVNTLKQQLTNVTTLQDGSLTPGTVELILGSDFTALAPAAAGSASSSASASSNASASPSASASSGASASSNASASPSASASSGTSAGSGASASPSASSSVANLAQSDNGITAAAACASDSSAFAGPDGS